MKVIITAQRGSGDYLLRELQLLDIGKFEKTDFKNVLIGEVSNLEDLLSKIEERPFLAVGKVVPIEVDFEFSLDEFPEKFIKHAEVFLDRISPDETFCVRVTRRGMKGLLSSREIAVKLGSFIQDSIEMKYGRKPKVDLEDPDKIIVVETIGNKCLMGMISKADRKRYYLLRP